MHVYVHVHVRIILQYPSCSTIVEQSFYGEHLRSVPNGIMREQKKNETKPRTELSENGVKNCLLHENLSNALDREIGQGQGQRMI